MKAITQKELKKELIKIINKNEIEEIRYEPRYFDPLQLSVHFKIPQLIGSIITIKIKGKNE